MERDVRKRTRKERLIVLGNRRRICCSYPPLLRVVIVRKKQSSAAPLPAASRSHVAPRSARSLPIPPTSAHSRNCPPVCSPRQARSSPLENFHPSPAPST